MIVIVSKYLIPKGYRGMTVFPFVFLKEQNSKNDLILLNHEKIHLRQQLELLIIPFFVWYFLEFLIRFLIKKDFKSAYRAICFEQEAYKNEANLNYHSERRLFSFLRYYIKNS